MHDYGGAIEEYGIVLAVRPDYAEAHVLRDMYDYNGAIAEYRKALSAKPDCNQECPFLLFWSNFGAT